VDIKTGIDVTEEMIKRGKPDAVILAIGADQASCPVEGITNSVVCNAWQILNGEIEPKDHVVIIGGGLVGMETAYFLCDKGIKDVILVEILAEPPVPPLTAHGTMLHRRLKAAGAKLMFNTTVKKVSKDTIIINTDGKEHKIAPVHQVIVAVGVKPRQALKEILKKENIRHFIIGDAIEPRRIIEATTEGAQAAWEI
jgi:pyruvate/2-oxoglutarate dehydrogenase complex dihydrolipoamide dehydrogenase (E3) component